MEVTATDQSTYTLLGLSPEAQAQNGHGLQPKASSRTCPSGYVIMALGLLSVILLNVLIVRWILCQRSHESACVHCPGCPDLWVRHGDHCYYFSAEEKDWNASLQFCLAQHAQLLMFANKTEMSLFGHFLREKFHWVGLRNRSGWRWEDGSALNFSRVLLNSAIQRCGAVSEVGLQASSCAAALPWVCKKHRG